MSHTLRNMIIAIALFAFGLVLVTSYIRGQNARIERGNDYVRVLVATKDIPAGTKASALETGGYVESEKVLRRDATPQAVHDLNEVEKLSLSQNVYAGEQISAYKFKTQSGLDPTAQIRGNQRIVSLKIEPTGTVGSMIRPGDHVDVLASADRNGTVSTWPAARDVIVLQTPDSLAAEATADAEPAEVKANGDPTLWVIQASDATVQYLLWSQANADDNGLQLVLRPSDGATNTKLTTQTTTPAVN